MNGDKGQQNGGERDEEAQVLSDGLLDVSDPQKHHGRVQVHPPVEPDRNEKKKAPFQPGHH